MKPLLRGSLLVVSLCLWGSVRVQAAVVVPTGLNPGDQYYLVFVTRDNTTATSTNIATYDAFAQAQAALNSSLTGTDLGVTWRALGSTSSVSAFTHLSLGAFPIYLLDGTTKVADNGADLWDGTLDNAINRDQFNSPIPGTLPTDYRNFSVWTGSLSDGSTSSYPLGGALLNGTLMAEEGNASESNSNWIKVTSPPSGTASPKAVTTNRHLYAFSELLTVPGSRVPEASSLIVWGLLLSGVGAQIWRSSKHEGASR